jgi:hypothetical protein
MEDFDSSSPVSQPKVKGQPIPGIDYGINIFDETSPEIKPEVAKSELKTLKIQKPFIDMSKKGNLVQKPTGYSIEMASQGSGGSDEFVRSGRSSPSLDQMNGLPLEYEEMSQDQSQSQSQSHNQSSRFQQTDHRQDYGQNLLNPGYMPQYSEAESVEEQPLTYEQRRERKINGLAALRRLEEAGYVPAGDKKFSFSSELGDIEETVERLKLQRDLDNSIKFQRKFLIGFANVVEFVCSTEYNIFDLKLEGWSESLFENITDYDEVFEELYFKYKDTVTVMPEVKLLMMVGGSAMMYHMSRELFSKTSSKVPGFDEVMSRDPDLKRRYTEAASNIARDRGMPLPTKQDKGGGLLDSLVKEFTQKTKPSSGQARSMQDRKSVV